MGKALFGGLAAFGSKETKDPPKTEKKRKSRRKDDAVTIDLSGIAGSDRKKQSSQKKKKQIEEYEKRFAAIRDNLKGAEKTDKSMLVKEMKSYENKHKKSKKELHP